MRNNETLTYRGYTVTKLHGNDFIVGGTHYKSYFEAQRAIDIEIAENKALNEIDNYVNDICNGWL